MELSCRRRRLLPQQVELNATALTGMPPLGLCFLPLNFWHRNVYKSHSHLGTTIWSEIHDNRP